MLMPSFNLTPLDFVLVCLSDPARSTMWNLDMVGHPSLDVGRDSTHRVKIAWDLELLWFIAVAAVTLRLLAFSITFIVASKELTGSSVNPGITIPLCAIGLFLIFLTLSA